MHEDELAELNQRLHSLAETLAHLSIQMGAAMRIGAAAMPKVHKEFEDVRRLAARLGVSLPERGAGGE